MFEFSIDGPPIRNPTLEVVCDLIRNGGDDKWLRGSGSAALYAGKATLFLYKKQGLGVVVRYEGPEGPHSLVATTPPVEGHIYYIGGNGYYVMPRYLVSVDEAVAAVTAFVDRNPPGMLTPDVTWEEVEMVEFPEHEGLPGWKPVGQ